MTIMLPLVISMHMQGFILKQKQLQSEMDSDFKRLVSTLLQLKSSESIAVSQMCRAWGGQIP